MGSRPVVAATSRVASRRAATVPTAATIAARVRAVLRRIRPGLADDRITVGDIIIDGEFQSCPLVVAAGGISVYVPYTLGDEAVDVVAHPLALHFRR